MTNQAAKARESLRQAQERGRMVRQDTWEELGVFRKSLLKGANEALYDYTHGQSLEVALYPADLNLSDAAIDALSDKKVIKKILKGFSRELGAPEDALSLRRKGLFSCLEIKFQACDNNLGWSDRPYKEAINRAERKWFRRVKQALSNDDGDGILKRIAEALDASSGEPVELPIDAEFYEDVVCATIPSMGQRPFNEIIAEKLGISVERVWILTPFGWPPMVEITP